MALKLFKAVNKSAQKIPTLVNAGRKLLRRGGEETRQIKLLGLTDTSQIWDLGPKLRYLFGR